MMNHKMGFPFSPFLLSVVFEILARAMRQEKKISKRGISRKGSSQFILKN